MSLSKYKLIYDKNGFVIVKKLINEKNINKVVNEIKIIKNKVQKLKNRKFFHKTNKGDINSIHNIQEFFTKGEITNLTKNVKLNQIVKKLVNKNSKVRNIEFFLKPAKTGLSAPFHQDNYYWNIVNAEALNIWIACSDANKDNGGVCYYKGSQNLGLIKHSISNAKGTSQKIPENILKKLDFQKVYPKLKKGDCIFHHPEVIHGSHKNKSNIDRIGLAVSYAANNHKIDKQMQMRYKKSLKKSLNNIYK